MKNSSVAGMSGELNIKDSFSNSRYTEKSIFLESKKVFRYINSNVSAAVTLEPADKNESSVSMMESVFVSGWVDKARFLTKEEFFKKLKKNG